jgi:hypothetical protein
LCQQTSKVTLKIELQYILYGLQTLKHQQAGGLLFFFFGRFGRKNNKQNLHNGVSKSTAHTVKDQIPASKLEFGANRLKL